MQIFRYPLSSAWTKISERPKSDFTAKTGIVKDILHDIKKNGDLAIREYTNKFDHIDIEDFRVSRKELVAAEKKVDDELKDAIKTAARNIHKFHESQRRFFGIVETMPGVKCWQKSVAIEKIGLYIPGGSAPLFSTVLMLGIPAQIAGCQEIILCTPPDKRGNIHPAILYAASLCNITSIYKVGGVQAIGGMAYGTETIPKVDKIFGPGNSWVTAAKQIVSINECAIDMPAGPSELAVIADDSANPAFIAADLLSQAEHGPDSQVIFVTNEDNLIEKVIAEIAIQLNALPRAEIASKALENSRAILLVDEEEILSFINRYAPEHLIIATRTAPNLADRVINAGSVFIGNYTPESAGDYASGTNHTLPTHGWSRSMSGVNLDSFCKKISFQEISLEGIRNIGPIIEKMAEAEHLFAHKNAATIRMKT
jgi:histidinol dehydrogenase